MSETAQGKARDLLAALTTSLSGEQWNTARRILAGEDPDLNRELHQLLDGMPADATLTATSPVSGMPADADLEPVHLIGPWKVVRTLGEGGFGVVYLAERADRLFDRQVAIKLTRQTTGMRTLLARFEAERRILAMLQHPNIAQLLDAGTTSDGRPYFVMEYVDGAPLTEYITSRALDHDQVLRLFLPICQAVDFAHQRLIVHRDLKPSNIMVTQAGEVKLLDFGIAKLLDAELASALTVPGHQPLTPVYASPEQILGEPVSTRTDVYALGVILYEAIAGRLPYGGATLESVMRAVLEHDPTPPTQRRRSEIDAMVLTALRKDPAQRYSSAGAMADDIERYLSGRPVKAHGDSRRYRAMKFVRRHRAGVLAAALVMLSLIGGLVATARESRIARTERARAEQREKEAVSERQRAEQQAELARHQQRQAESARAQAQSRANDVRSLARDLLVDMQETVSTLPGGSAAREQLVSRAIAYLNRLETESAGEPELEAEIALGYRKLGDLYEVLYRPGSDNMRRALDAYGKSGARLRSLVDRNPERVEWRVALAAAESGIGAALDRLGRGKEAEAAWRRAMHVLERAGDGNEALGVRGDTQLHLARLRWRQTGQAEEPLRLARQALVWKRTGAEAAPRPGVLRSLASSEGYLALILAESGDGTAALKQVAAAQAALDKALALQPGDFLAQRDRINFRLVQGNTEWRMGQTERAAATFQAALDAATRLLETDPGNVNVRYDVGNAHSWLGDMLSQMGKPDQAREHYQILIQTVEALAKADAGNIVLKESMHSGYLRLGDSLADEGRYAEAEKPYRAALKASEEMVVLSKESPAMIRELAFSCQRLGEVGLNTKNERGGMEWQRKAVQLHQRTVTAAPNNADYLISLGSAWAALGDIERRIRRQGGEAEEFDSYRQAFDTNERAVQLRPEDREAQLFMGGAAVRYGQRLLERGSFEAARTVLEKSRDIRKKLSEADPKLARHRRDLAISYSLLGEVQAKLANKALSCQSLATARDLTAALEREGQRINNPLLASARWTSLMAGCEGK